MLANFNYIKPTKFIYIKNPKAYRLASVDDVKRLNNYLDVLFTATTFYEKFLSSYKIDYVYKEKASINVLPVKYKKENFPHLTGINFAFTSANERFSLLQNGNNQTPIIIERGNYTFDKLELLDRLPDLIKSETSTLTQLQNVQQAKNVGFSKGIKNESDDLLIALKNFNP